MEDRRGTRRMPARLAQAAVTWQFQGCRSERQLLTQAFDLIWQGPGDVPLGVRYDRGDSRSEPRFEDRLMRRQAQGVQP
jgi:hypothetical protein